MIFPWGGSETGVVQKQGGTLLAMTTGTLKDTPALDALKASCGAPISMGRGEIPVGCCQRPSGFVAFIKSKVIIGGSHAKKCNSFYAK